MCVFYTEKTEQKNHNPLMFTYMAATRLRRHCHAFEAPLPEVRRHGHMQRSVAGLPGGHRRRATTGCGGYMTAGCGGLRAKALLPGRLLPVEEKRESLPAREVIDYYGVR